MPFVAIALSVVCSICGQLVLKYSMIRLPAGPGRPFVLRLATSPLVITGLAIYGLGVIFWLVALSHLELSFVYPFASLSYVGIILGSHFLFSERIDRARLIGIAVIMGGLLIISQS